MQTVITIDHETGAIGVERISDAQPECDVSRHADALRSWIADVGEDMAVHAMNRVLEELDGEPEWIDARCPLAQAEAALLDFMLVRDADDPSCDDTVTRAIMQADLALDRVRLAREYMELSDDEPEEWSDARDGPLWPGVAEACKVALTPPTQIAWARGRADEAFATRRGRKLPAFKPNAWTDARDLTLRDLLEMLED